jgi:hypothetical protein
VRGCLGRTVGRLTAGTYLATCLKKPRGSQGATGAEVESRRPSWSYLEIKLAWGGCGVHASPAD